MDQLSTRTDYEFLGFRLDTALQVLVAPTGGIIALPARAYDALHYLVDHNGELVEKTALMRAVWPDTVVEENNLNQCILTLRRAFGESPGERRFILTVPGRGFKFVAPVRPIPSGRDGQACVPPVAARRGSSRPVLIAGSALLAALILAAVFVFAARSGPVTIPTEYQALTDLSDSATAPALSADGRMLTFLGGGGMFLGTGQVYVKLLPDGEPTRLANIPAGVYDPQFSLDGARIAFTSLTLVGGKGSWNTWTVPTTGGQPSLLLGNAAGLTWIAPQQLLYSEIRSGIHMGVVTSAEDRAWHRDVYLPAHERGMAHYSWLSPDRRSVLVVEMGGTGAWQPCRRVPFDGSSAGEQIGPTGRCTAAAWSPDGRWMYFSAEVGGHSHLWRQRYPRGEPEQITFGPTEQEGVAVAPDGRSLVTSLGLVQSSIWIHDAGGEHRITDETVAYAPRLTADAQRLYFLSQRAAGNAATLWRLDKATGQRQSVLSQFDIVDYDISADEREVVFSIDHGGEMQAWIAPLDHHLPPRLLARGADEPAFDGSGQVFFRLLGTKANHLYRIRQDGSASQRMLGMPILDFHSVSPTGRWAAVQAVIDGEVATAILGVGGESFRWVRNGYWPSRWSADGRTLYLEIGEPNSAFAPGRTLPVSLVPGASPQIPALPLASADGILPHATSGLAPGPDPSTYAYTQTQQLQNIYRIPLHN